MFNNYKGLTLILEPGYYYAYSNETTIYDMFALYYTGEDVLINILSNIETEIILVGGGGGAGKDINNVGGGVGGGGGGGVYSHTFETSIGNYPIYVGSGGSFVNGENTKLIGNTMYSVGGGGQGASYANGNQVIQYTPIHHFGVNGVTYESLNKYVKTINNETYTIEYCADFRTEYYQAKYAFHMDTGDPTYFNASTSSAFNQCI